MAKNVQSRKHINQTAEARALSAPKTEVERFEIMNIIGTQYLKGAGAYDIHRHCLAVGHRLSVKSVYNYINRLKKEWLENRLAAIDERVAQELAKIDLVEFEAWEAWNKSKQDLQKSFNKTIFEGEPKEGQKPKIKSNEASKTVQQSNGDAEFLKVIQWCIDKRLEIIGFGKLNVNIVDNSMTTTTNIENRVSAQFRGGLTIIRDVRERPKDESYEDVSPLAKDLEDFQDFQQNNQSIE